MLQSSEQQITLCILLKIDKSITQRFKFLFQLENYIAV